VRFTDWPTPNFMTELLEIEIGFGSTVRDFLAPANP